MAKKRAHNINRFAHALFTKHTGQSSVGKSYEAIALAVTGVAMGKAEAKSWLLSLMQEKKLSKLSGGVSVTKLARLLYIKKFNRPASHPRLKIVLIVQDLTGLVMDRDEAASWVRGHENQIPELLAHNDSLQPPARRKGKTSFAKRRAERQKFYISREWRSVRYQALKKHGASCLACGRSAKDGIVIHVDHVKPRSKHPELELDVNNLQILCADCNLGKGAWDETDWRQP